MTYGTRRFKVGLGTSVDVIDAIVDKWESKGFDVEVECCTAGLYPLIRPERVGWGGADFDPHIGSLGQRYGRD